MPNKKPRILIAMHYMELGGAESALLGLLQAHDPERADIDLFLYAHRGELIEFIPIEKVNMIYEITEYSLLEAPMKEVVKRGYLKLAKGRLTGHKEFISYSRFNYKKLPDFTEFTYQQYRTVSLLPDINPLVEYDLAISFMTPHYIVLDKVRAKRKLGWIHTDYTNVFLDEKMELEMWSRLDYIASISEEVGNKFCEVFPSLREKIVPIENILSSVFIRHRSLEFVPEDMRKEENVINLLSIGRYSYPKRFDFVGTLCRLINEQLKNSGSHLHAKWYIIGYGSKEEEEKMLKNIADENMEDMVVTLGKRTNPYPYIKNCDIYVQPSRYEGKSITVREAQILEKPVVVSNYPTACSQINSGVDGQIVPLDNEGCAKGIAEFILNEPLKQQIMEYLSTHNCSNEEEIEKIYNLLPL